MFAGLLPRRIRATGAATDMKETRMMKVAKSLMYILAAISLSAASLMSCSSGESAKLTKITISPAVQSMVKGTTLQFTATGTFTDNTVVNYTPGVIWNSSDVTIATVSNINLRGIVTSLATGTTLITAIEPTKNMSSSNAVVLSVDDHGAITITPVEPYLSVGKPHAFTATATFDDGSQQNLTALTTWSTSDSLVAAVSNTPGSIGLVTAGTTTGSAVISATSGNYFVSTVTGTTIITVMPTPLTSLAITQVAPIISLGTTTQLTARGGFQDGSTTPELVSSWIWSSSNALVSTIGSTSGLVTSGTVTGTTTIKATDPVTNISSSGTTLTVE